MQQVASILRDARPKIQKWISNAESDDPESLGLFCLFPDLYQTSSYLTPPAFTFTDTYLQINDQINTVLNRYESYKKGDFTAAANPIPPELSNGAGPSGSQSISLIDFDDTPAPSGGIDELASLFGPSPTAAPEPAPVAVPTSNFSGLPYGAGTGFGAPASAAYPAPTPLASASNGLGTPNSHPPRQGTVSPSSGAPLGSIRLGTPQLQPQTPSYPQQPAQNPSYFGQPAFQQQQQQQQPQYAQFQQPLQPQPQAQTSAQTQQAQQKGKDPFADLVGLF